MPSGSTQIRVPFDTDALGVSALGDPRPTLDDLTLADIAVLHRHPGATTVTGSTDAIIQNVRGCELGTGVQPTTCVPRAVAARRHLPLEPDRGRRAARLHPGAVATHAFATANATRDKMIYAGANDGFLHAFDGGDVGRDAADRPTPGYDRGHRRRAVRLHAVAGAPQHPQPAEATRGTRDYYYVDGSPAAADVWIHTTADAAPRRRPTAASGRRCSRAACARAARPTTRSTSPIRPRSATRATCGSSRRKARLDRDHATTWARPGAADHHRR